MSKLREMLKVVGVETELDRPGHLYRITLSRGEHTPLDVLKALDRDVGAGYFNSWENPAFDWYPDANTKDRNMNRGIKAFVDALTPYLREESPNPSRHLRIGDNWGEGSYDVFLEDAKEDGQYMLTLTERSQNFHALPFVEAALEHSLKISDERHYRIK